MEFRGSESEKNLQIALAGESQNITAYKELKKQTKAQNKEASLAFEDSIKTQKENARLWFEALNGGAIYGTLASLHGAAKNADEEWVKIYREFAKTAREEGFDALGDQFEKAAQGKENSAQAYAKWLESDQNPTE